MNFDWKSSSEESLETCFNWFNHSMTLTKLTPLFRFSKDMLTIYIKDLVDMIRRAQLPRLKLFETCRWNWVKSSEGDLGDYVWIHFLFSVDEISGKCMTYTCLLVSDVKEMDKNWGKFPLLISRMPVELLQITLNYLTTRFDAWATPFQLSSTTLMYLLQNYITSIEPGSEEAFHPLELMFSIQSIKGLRRIIIGVKGQDMLVWREREYGFLKGLKKYLLEQTTIDFDQFELCRIGCAGFVVSAEGKLKMLKPIQLQIITTILKMEIKGNM